MRNRAMKTRKLPILYLALCWLGATSNPVSASGDFGDFEAQSKVATLPQEEVEKYYTENVVVGRDMEQGQCSKNVLEFRQKMAVSTLSNIVFF